MRLYFQTDAAYENARTEAGEKHKKAGALLGAPAFSGMPEKGCACSGGEVFNARGVGVCNGPPCALFFHKAQQSEGHVA